MPMRKLPPLNALKAFEAAARHESLTSAAEELRVTHSAIGQHVKQLERFSTNRFFRSRADGSN